MSKYLSRKITHRNAIIETDWRDTWRTISNPIDSVERAVEPMNWALAESTCWCLNIRCVRDFNRTFLVCGIPFTDLGAPFFPGGHDLWHHPLAYSATTADLPSAALQHATLVHPALHPQVPVRSYLWLNPEKIVDQVLHQVSIFISPPMLVANHTNNSPFQAERT